MAVVKKPNVLLIIIDSLRYDHLGCYGYERNTTTFIDQLSKESLVFQSAISPSGWTLGVFPSVFTGTYPSKNGLSVEGYQTIMDVLHSCGYRSFGITDNFFAEPLRGFDDFMYLTQSRVMRMARSRNIVALMGVLGSAVEHKSLQNIRSIAPSFLKSKLTKTWLDKHGNNPWFIMVHYDVHWPYNPPKTFRDRFLSKPLIEKIGTVRHDVYELIAASDLADRIEVLKALYDAQIAWVDACVGDLLNHLKSLGIYDNTLIIVMSDHGDLLGEHGLLHHEFVLYDPLIRVPFIIKFPDRSNAGKKYSGLVQTIDILPTLIDYLGLQTSASEQIQGKSLIKLIAGQDKREFTISERSDWTMSTSGEKITYLEKAYPTFNWKQFAHEIVALRTNEHKYIWSSDGHYELYDLKNDPQETHNSVSTNSEIAVELHAKLIGWMNSFSRVQAAQAETDEDPAVKERLRALGYI